MKTAVPEEKDRRFTGDCPGWAADSQTATRRGEHPGCKYVVLHSPAPSGEAETGEAEAEQGQRAGFGYNSKACR